jgi:hypothetical protein
VLLADFINLLLARELENNSCWVLSYSVPKSVRRERTVSKGAITLQCTSYEAFFLFDFHPNGLGCERDSLKSFLRYLVSQVPSQLRKEESYPLQKST